MSRDNDHIIDILKDIILSEDTIEGFKQTLKNKFFHNGFTYDKVETVRYNDEIISIIFRNLEFDSIGVKDVDEESDITLLNIITKKTSRRVESSTYLSYKEDTCHVLIKDNFVCSNTRNIFNDMDLHLNININFLDCLIDRFGSRLILGNNLQFIPVTWEMKNRIANKNEKLPISSFSRKYKLYDSINVKSISVNDSNLTDKFYKLIKKLDPDTELTNDSKLHISKDKIGYSIKTGHPLSLALNRNCFKMKSYDNLSADTIFPIERELTSKEMLLLSSNLKKTKKDK